MFKIGNDLVEAYLGYFEEEYAAALEEARGDKKLTDQEAKELLRKLAEIEIMKNSPLRRLEIYLEWNGILGYSARIYEVATGQL